QINTAFYETFTKPNTILVLSQAYDPGWKAYEIKNSSSFAKTLPFIFGKELKNHQLVNNWANGWETENGGTTIMLYAPTYLQIIGQLITITVLIILLSYTISNLKKKHVSR